MKSIDHIREFLNSFVKALPFLTGKPFSTHTCPGTAYPGTPAGQVSRTVPGKYTKVTKEKSL